MDEYITSRAAKKVLQVSECTLRRWADNGLIPSIRTPTGHRLYDVKRYLATELDDSQHQQRQRICYCRVSSQGQKDDLQQQVAYMQDKFPDHRIITDIGSGINFRRQGLRTILALACKGFVSEVVVAYRDRLCRFAFELLEWFLQLHGTQLVVLNQTMDSTGQTELAEDLLAIVNVFNCRVNGKRKYTRRQQTQDQNGPESEEVNGQAKGERLSENPPSPPKGG